MENQKVILIGNPEIANAHLFAELASMGYGNIEIIEPQDVTKDMLPRFDGHAQSPFAREPMVLHAPLNYSPTLNHPPVEQYKRNTPKVSRNALCPCGSGRKSKRCNCKK